MSLLKFTASGIYCQQADIYIDPWKEVNRAVITHAHSDHARYGNRHYLAHKDSEVILRMRLGDDISLQTADYGEVITINGVRISLHPAGHMIGSSQIRLEYKGEVWVASGDYKIQDDHFSEPFELIKCDTYITESTFGLPVYKWQRQDVVISQINEWWMENTIENKTSILIGYAAGKMQRLLINLQPFSSSVYAHGAIYNLNEKLRNAGYNLPYIKPVAGETDKRNFKGAMVLAPSSALNSAWMRRFDNYSTAYCSGWMAIRGAKNRRAADRGFALSDHADWNDLNYVIRETGASQVFVTHGYTDVFARWLNENSIKAAEVKTMFGDEQEEMMAEVKNDDV